MNAEQRQRRFVPHLFERETRANLLDSWINRIVLYPSATIRPMQVTKLAGLPAAETREDTDPDETQEWRAAFESLLGSQGPQRARFLLDELVRLARMHHVDWQPELCTPYLNSISVTRQPPYPGDLALEERLAALMRWNALVMVVRANQAYGELGGHIASYASAADLFETGFNHFFRARDAHNLGDLVFFQPHSAPGVYARAFLEGRLDEADLLHYRQEIRAPRASTGQGARGLSSYPHPYLMPDFWQFPTGSMGIGPIPIEPVGNCQKSGISQGCG